MGEGASAAAAPSRRAAAPFSAIWPVGVFVGYRRQNGGQGRLKLADFVGIERGLGPEGRIAVVRFDRGDGINALSPEALRQLTDAARSFEDDAETSVVVLAGKTTQLEDTIPLMTQVRTLYRAPFLVS